MRISLLLMAGVNDLVELESSDEENVVTRRPIGWNCQGIQCAKKQNWFQRHRELRKSDDDIQVIDISSEKDSPCKSFPNASHQNFKFAPKVKNYKVLPSSFSRHQIKSLVRSSEQTSMNDFMSATSSKKRKEYNSNPSDSALKKIKLSSSIDNEGINIQNESCGNVEETTTEAVSTCVDYKNTTAIISDVVNENHVYDKSEDSKVPLVKFISRWKELKPFDSKSDTKIEDKIWKYFHLAHTSYTHSRKFKDKVALSEARLTVDNIYVLVKDILDCLKCYKDVPYKVKHSVEEGIAESTEQAELLTEEERKKEKKLRKIEKMMKAISEKINQLDEAEVDLDDEDNSAYLVQERLKAQFMKLDDYYCKLAECSRSTGRPVEKKFRYEGSRYPEINQRITAYINKHREFPDYQDVLNLVKKVANDSLLPLRPETVRVQAQEIFRDVGKMLKERRESDDLYSIYSYVPNDLPPDPAAADQNLACKLDNNAELAKDQLTKVFQHYVDQEATLREANDKKALASDDSRSKTTNSDEENNASDDCMSDMKPDASRPSSRENVSCSNASIWPESSTPKKHSERPNEEHEDWEDDKFEQEEIVFHSFISDKDEPPDNAEAQAITEIVKKSGNDEMYQSDDNENDVESLPDIGRQDEEDGNTSDHLKNDRQREEHLTDLEKQPTNLKFEEKPKEETQLTSKDAGKSEVVNSSSLPSVPCNGHPNEKKQKLDVANVVSSVPINPSKEDNVDINSDASTIYTPNEAAAESTENVPVVNTAMKTLNGMLDSVSDKTEEKVAQTVTRPEQLSLKSKSVAPKIKIASRILMKPSFSIASSGVGMGAIGFGDQKPSCTSTPKSSVKEVNNEISDDEDILCLPSNKAPDDTGVTNLFRFNETKIKCEDSSNDAFGGNSTRKMLPSLSTKISFPTLSSPRKQKVSFVNDKENDSRSTLSKHRPVTQVFSKSSNLSSVTPKSKKVNNSHEDAFMTNEDHDDEEDVQLASSPQDYYYDSVDDHTAQWIDNSEWMEHKAQGPSRASISKSAINRTSGTLSKSMPVMRSSSPEIVELD